MRVQDNRPEQMPAIKELALGDVFDLNGSILMVVADGAALRMVDLISYQVWNWDWACTESSMLARMNALHMVKVNATTLTLE